VTQNFKVPFNKLLTQREPGLWEEVLHKLKIWWFIRTETYATSTLGLPVLHENNC